MEWFSYTAKKKKCTYTNTLQSLCIGPFVRSPFLFYLLVCYHTGTPSKVKRPLKMSNESEIVASLRKRLQRQILRYAVLTFKNLHLQASFDDELKLTSEQNLKMKEMFHSQEIMADNAMHDLMRLQKMAYHGQQRHELKVSDARILLGRVRQRALRLMQSTKQWKDSHSR